VPDGSAHLVKPPFAGKLSGFTLLFEALVLMLAPQMEGIVAWAQTRQTNGFLEALNGLFQAAKRRAHGFASFDTIRTVFFLIAGKLDFAAVNPHAR